MTRAALAVLLLVPVLNGCGNLGAQQKTGVIHLESGDIPYCDSVPETYGASICKIREAQLDVPPKEWDTTEHNSAHDCWQGCVSTMPSPQEPPETISIHHIACEDKTRFKLQSEDGKWHCLKLVP